MARRFPRGARLASGGRASFPFTAAGIVAAIGVVLTVAFLLFLGLTRFSPVFFGDEIGYLANAISIAGGPDLAISADSYYPGWSLVLVPLWWIFRDPLAFYRGAVILSAVSSIATIPVLAALGRRLGLSRAAGILASCVVVALPAHSLMAGFALAESFVGLTTASATLLAVVAAQKSSPRWYAAAGAVAGLAFVTHGRLVGLIAASVLWGLVLLIRRRFLSGSALIVSSALVSAAGYALYRHLEVVVYRSTGREADGVAKLFGSDPGATALTASGQVWYLVVATAGLAVPGLILLAREVVTEARERRPAWACWTIVWIVGLAAVSVTYVSRSVSQRDRLDLFVYGRYLEPATDLLALFGLVLLIRLASRVRVTAAGSAERRRWYRVPAACVFAFAVVAVGYGVLARAVVPTANQTTSGWNPMNVLGLSQYGWTLGKDDATLPIVQAALFGGGVLVVTVVLARIVRNPTWLLSVALAFALTSAVVGQVRTVQPAYSGFAHSFRLAQVLAYTPDASVAFVTAADPVFPHRSTVVSRNAYQFFLAPRVVPVWTSSTTLPPTRFAIARRVWPVGSDAGWQRIAQDTGSDNALWERPGS